LLRVVPEWDLSLAAPLAFGSSYTLADGNRRRPGKPGRRSSPGEKTCLPTKKKIS
jgi:hypothetical protein